MSLPWFAFNIKDFLANTKRLNTEAKGAYLCLMLDYYEQGHGAPDDDDVLAAICELPVGSWQRHRKVIAPLFEIKDGSWSHGRIDDELRNGQRRYDQTLAATAAAKAAREAKKSATDASRKPERSPQRSPRRLTVIETDSVPSNVTDNVTTTQEQEHPLKERTGGESAHPVSLKAPEEIGSMIDPGFEPNAASIQRAHDQGATDSDIDSELRKFIAHHQIKESRSPNWQASWVKWWEGWKPHRDRVAPKAKAPPRIDYGTIDWEGFCKRFAGGMGWPKGVGPDPDSSACQCPLEILQKHGLRSAPAEAVS